MFHLVERCLHHGDDGAWVELWEVFENSSAGDVRRILAEHGVPPEDADAVVMRFWKELSETEQSPLRCFTGNSLRDLKKWLVDSSVLYTLRLVEAGKVWLGGKKRKKAKRIEPRRHQFEALEPRQLLAADLLGFQLQHDTGAADLVTMDPTVTAEVSGNFTSGSAGVEFDHDGDQVPEATVGDLQPGDVLSYDPRATDASLQSHESPLTLVYRVLEYDESQNLVDSGDWQQFSFTIDLDVGDTIGDALQLVLTPGVAQVQSQTIGDSADSSSDVDIYQVDLQAGQTLSADIDAEYLDDGTSLSTLDSYLRVFDSYVYEVASNDDANDPDTGQWSYDSALSFTAPSDGTFYIGVSHYNNSSYDPTGADDAYGGDAYGGEGYGGDGYGGPWQYQLDLETYLPEPEITLYVASEDDGYGGDGYGDLSYELVEDSSSFDFGSTVTGLPLTRDFKVENDGTTDLTVDFDNLTLPTGFSLVSFESGEVLISPDGFETFTIQLDASGAGQYGGAMSLPNNDSDENPFDLNISGEVIELQPDLPGDTLDSAQQVTLTAGVEQEIAAEIGDGLYPQRDVDLYQIELLDAQTLSADVDAQELDDGSWLSNLDSYLRLFDASGNEIDYNDDASDPDTGQWGYDSALTFTAAVGGTFFVGVSDYSNSYYDPIDVDAYGGDGGSQGEYRLQLFVDDPPLPEPESLFLTSNRMTAMAGRLSNWWMVPAALTSASRRSALQLRSTSRYETRDPRI